MYVHVRVCMYVHVYTQYVLLMFVFVSFSCILHILFRCFQLYADTSVYTVYMYTMYMYVP